jgi:nicotinic acid mononucleotide adenylyltransferase
MVNTTAQDVFDSFESSFKDKVIIPEALEIVWLKKAVGRYSIELSPISFDSDMMEFDRELDQYSIDTLAAFMKQSYQEREVSRINKQVSITGKDVSITMGQGGKTAVKEELDYCDSQSEQMIANQKPTAYS